MAVTYKNKYGPPNMEALDLAVYWIKERDAIWQRRFAKGQPPPWTDDPYLQKHSWTNTTRRKDRGTIHWYRSVYRMWATGSGYTGRADLLVFNTCLYRIFNRITTWEAIVRAVGEPLVTDWSKRTRNKIIKELERVRDEHGAKIFTQAYFTWGGGHHRSIGRGNKPRFYINECVQTAWDGRHAVLEQWDGTQEAVYNVIKTFLAYGPFIASQIVYDLTYTILFGTEWVPKEENWYEDDVWGITLPQGHKRNIGDFNQWVMCGPGAKNFLRLLWPHVAFGTEQELTEGCRVYWGELRKRSKSNPVQELDLHDAENSLCECWKYYKLVQGRRFNPRIYKPGG